MKIKKIVAIALAAVMLVALTACGSSNSAIEFTMDELFRYSKAEAWIDVCKIPQQEE